MSRRITIYLSDEQGSTIDSLPHKISFSGLVRSKFDSIVEDYVEKKDNVKMTTR